MDKKTNNEILLDLIESGWVKETCVNIARNNDLSDDLFQEVCLIVLEYDNAKLNIAHNEKWLKYMLINVIKNQSSSKTSKFYKKFKKFNIEMRDANYNLGTDEFITGFIELEKAYINIESSKIMGDKAHSILSKIESALEKVHWYDRELFIMYFRLLEYSVGGDKYDVTIKKKRLSLRDIEKTTSINHNSVGNSINGVLKFLKKKFEEEYNYN